MVCSPKHYYSKKVRNKFFNVKPTYYFLVWFATISLIVSNVCADSIFNIKGPEVTKIDWNTRSLIYNDFDNDGLIDMAVINNDIAKINILYQRNPKSNQSNPRRSIKVNRWDPVLEDSRFVKDSVVTGAYLLALNSGDLNNDGLVDLVYTTNTEPLVVRYQSKDKNWSDQWTYDYLKPQQWVSTLQVRDLNNDNRDDLVVLAARKILVFFQNDAGLLLEPKTYLTAEKNTRGLQLSDLNNDGKLDIHYIVSNSENSLRVRFQDNIDGKFGPEHMFPVNIGSANIAPQLNAAKNNSKFVYIDVKTRMLEFFSLNHEYGQLEKLEDLHPQTYATNNSNNSSAKYTSGDFNNDKRLDILVGDSDTAEFLLYLQNKSGDFEEPITFPTFDDLSGLAAGDFKGKGITEIIVVSKDEGILGQTKLNKNGRISFPKIIPTDGKPYIVAADNLDDDKNTELILFEKNENKYNLTIVRWDNDLDFWTYKSIPVNNIKRDPETILTLNLNNDHYLDILLIIPREPARLFVNDTDGNFSEVAVDSVIRKSMLTNINPSRIGTGDLDNDGFKELIISQEGYARSLKLNDDNVLEIIDQFNARQNDDDIFCPLVFDIDSDNSPDLIFYNKNNFELQLLQKDKNDVFRYIKSIEVGEIDLTNSTVTSIYKNNLNRLFFFGKNRFWVVPLDKKGWAINSLGNYETDLKNVIYTGLETADMNNDGVLDILVIDAQNHILEILNQVDDNTWNSVLHFTVFDENIHFQGRRGSPLEPREMIVADLTGDNKTDIALLIHDRILLYYQE